MNREFVKFYFYKQIIADILRAIEGGALSGSFTLAFCCIDYLGLAMEQHSKDKNFYEYLKCYLARLNKDYNLRKEIIYAARCSFVHVFGPSKFESQLYKNDYDKPVKIQFMYRSDDIMKTPHLNFNIIDNSYVFYIVLEDLVNDLISSTIDFFDEIPDKDLNKWKDKLFVFSQNHISEKETEYMLKWGKYSNIHSCFEVIDQYGFDSVTLRRWLIYDVKKLVKKGLNIKRNPG